MKEQEFYWLNLVDLQIKKVRGQQYGRYGDTLWWYIDFPESENYSRPYHQFGIHLFNTEEDVLRAKLEILYKKIAPYTKIISDTEDRLKFLSEEIKKKG